jgi:hypothetical protein
MSEKRMLIVDTELLERIDQNRDDMSRAEFIDFLINNQLNGESKNKSKENGAVLREEFDQFQEGVKELLRSFLDFFITYGLELGKKPEDEKLQQLNHRLQAVGISEKK